MVMPALEPAPYARVNIAVVIPCFRVKKHIEAVLAAIPPWCKSVYVVDDACPEHTGNWVETSISDGRVRVLYHSANRGVGGASLTGMQQAFDDGADVVVKIDGDGQMDPALLGRFVGPLLRGDADYAKGNRFYALEDLADMPCVRLWGNAALSLVSKLSSGYWSIFDPTNGYIAIHRTVYRALPAARVDNGFFFESDMLFHLNLLRAS
jgi:dolichol-phosphate mannosyltransferase